MFAPQFITNISTEWRSVLSILGKPASGYRLPALEICPSCQAKRLRIFDDNLTGRQWHYCLGCRSRGDMVTLAAKCWRTDYNDAANRLKLAGAIKELDTVKFLDQTNTWARFDDLFGKLRSPESWEDKDSIALIKVFSNSPFSTQDFRSRLGWFYAATKKSVIEANWESNLQTALFTDEEIADAKKTKLLAGKMWKHVLMLPYFDQPFRVSTVGMFTKDGKQDHVAFKQPLAENDDLGLCFHPGLFLSAPQTIFAVPSMQRILAIHADWFYSRADLPPVVGYLDTESKRTRNAWQMFSNSKIVILYSELNAQTIVQAFENNHDVCQSILGSDNTAMNVLQMHYTFRALEKKVTTWQHALKVFTARADKQAMVDLFAGIKFRLGDQFSDFRSALPDEVINILDHLNIDMSVPKIHRTGLADVYESEEGWFYERNGKFELLSDAVAKVDKVYGYDSGKVLHRGRIYFRGKELLFSTKSVDPKKNIADIVRRHIVAAGIGVPNISDQKLFAEAVSAASKPTIVRAAENVGWNRKTSELVTKHFRLLPDKPADISESVDVLEVSGGNLVPDFEVLPNRVSQLLADTENNQAVWSLWGAYMYCILAPTQDLTPTSFICSSKFDKVFHKIGSACGAEEISLKGNRLLQKTQWPVTFDSKKHDDGIYPGALTKTNSIFVLAREKRHLIREHISPQNRMIYSKTTVKLPLLTDLGSFTSAFLKFAITKVDHVVLSVKTIFELAKTFCIENDLNSAVFSSGKTNIRKPKISKGVALALREVMETPGAIRTVRPVFFDHYCVWEEGNTVSMTAKTLEWSLKHATKTNTFQMNMILKDLLQTDVLLGITTQNKHTCLAFRKEWWDQNIRRPRLKLVQKSSA